MRTGDNARGCELMDQLAGFLAVFIGKDQLAFSGTVNAHLCGPVQVAVGVAGQGDRLFPGFHVRLDAFYQNGGPEYGSVQGGPDGGVGAFPHFFQVILLNTLQVGGNGGAFYRDAIFFGGLRRVDGHLVLGSVPVSYA